MASTSNFAIVTDDPLEIALFTLFLKALRQVQGTIEADDLFSANGEIEGPMIELIHKFLLPLVEEKQRLGLQELQYWEKWVLGLLPTPPVLDLSDLSTLGNPPPEGWYKDTLEAFNLPPDITLPA
jgi:hypothetical protein